MLKNVRGSNCYFPGDEGRRKQLLSRLLQKDTVTELPTIEVEFERCLRTYQPRHVATYTTGIGGNLTHGDKKYFIDAAIAEWTPGEVKKLKSIKIVGTIHYPSDKCIPATTRDLTNARELCKSGRTTGYTTSKKSCQETRGCFSASTEQSHRNKGCVVRSKEV